MQQSPEGSLVRVGMPAGLRNLPSLKLPVPTLRLPARKDEAPLPAPPETGLSKQTDSRGSPGAPTLEGHPQPDAYSDQLPGVSPPDSHLIGPHQQEHLRIQQQAEGQQLQRGAITEYGGRRRDSATSAAASAAATALLASVPSSQAPRIPQPALPEATAAAAATWILPKPHQTAVSNPVGNGQAGSAAHHQQQSGDTKNSTILPSDTSTSIHATKSEPSSRKWSAQHPQPNNTSQPTSASPYFCFVPFAQFSTCTPLCPTTLATSPLSAHRLADCCVPQFCLPLVMEGSGTRGAARGGLYKCNIK